MATTEFIAAIELGSSKITGVAGRKNSDGSMQVLAYAQEDSSTFIRKGVIFNLDKTAQSHVPSRWAKNSLMTGLLVKAERVIGVINSFPAGVITTCTSAPCFISPRMI